MAAAAYWAALGSLVSTAISVIAEIALLVVALTIVRRRNASAGTWMACAAGLWLGLTMVTTIAYSGVAMLVDRSASARPEAIVKGHALLGIALTVMRTAGWALMLVGVVQLATGGRKDDAGPANPTG